MLTPLNSQLHIAVCDDDPLDLQRSTDMAREILAAIGQDCVFSTYTAGAELLDAIRRGADFHMLLLDVMMDGMDGIELAAALRGLGDRSAILFVSSNREMALRGYEVAAVRYLSKPLDPDKLREALLFCCKSINEKRDILVPTDGGLRRISLSKIVYAEAMERVTKLVTPEYQEELTIKFSQMEALLPKARFFQCHRSYLVNLDYVSRVGRRDLELTTGGLLPISKYRLAELQKAVINRLKG